MWLIGKLIRDAEWIGGRENDQRISRVISSVLNCHFRNERTCHAIGLNLAGSPTSSIALPQQHPLKHSIPRKQDATKGNALIGFRTI